MATNLQKRLSTKIVESNGCWIWTGAMRRDGYGKIRPGGRAEMVLAHKAVYELAIGPVPDGLELDHLCRNRRCVNPAHLEPVTHRENIRRGARCIAKSDRVVLDGSVPTCSHGHPRTPENVLWSRNGDGRVVLRCRPCRARQSREQKRRRADR